MADCLERARRQRVAKYGKVQALMTQSGDSLDIKAGGKLNPAFSRNLNSVWRDSRVVAERYQDANIEDRRRCAGIERESQNAA